MKHLANKTPYANSGIPAAQSKGRIEEMLKEFGAKAMRWTETPDSMAGKECPILEFILEIELEGVRKQFGIRIQPPLLEQRKQHRSGPIVKNMNASMRLLYWYLKARMEAVRFGLEDVTETFMSKIIMELPEGGTSTMGEVIRERPTLISDLLPSFEIKPKQLEAKVIENTA